MSALASGGFWAFVAVVAGIYTILALGLQLQFGFTGLLNFGQVAFMAIGAYTMAILVVKEGWSRSWVSSQSDAVTNNAAHATAPTGPSGAGSSAWLRPRHPMAMARAATRATGTVAGHE